MNDQMQLDRPVTVEDIPNMLSIVGAPRCGTTSLAFLLRQHPEVNFPYVKEPHFFSRFNLNGADDAELRERVEGEYLDRFFFKRVKGTKVAVDGSVSYLYAPELMKPILRLWPDAKFIIAVRDPMKMLPSYHQRLLVTGDETLQRFEDAWAATADRAQGRRIPRSAIDPRALRYDEVARYATHAEAFIDAVGRDRIFFSVFDDLVADPVAQYRKMCEFIGLEPWGDTNFAREREGRGVRVPALQRLLMRPPVITRKLLAGDKYRQRVRKVGPRKEDSALVKRVFEFREKLIHWNKTPLVRQPIPVAVQQDIRGRLSGEIERLGLMLDRDLSHWLKVEEQN